MKVAAAIALVGVVAADYELEWAAFQKEQGAQNGVIPQAFKDNVDAAKAHNAQNLSYTMGWTGPFAAMTQDEFIAQYTGVNGRPNTDGSVLLGTLEEVEVGDAIDWVGKGVVNPVKNQGQCGSCWAFSTVGTLESAYAISTGNLLSLAEQQLVDCDKSDNGCSGGWPYSAYDNYYAENNGACSEDSYTYTAQGGYCQAQSCTVSVPAGTVTGHQNVGQSQSGLKSALGQQPVSVTVNAGQLQLYANGVVTGDCQGQINHAVIAVGYGTDGLDYFKIRNSWGANWGEAGYVRLAQQGGSQGTACLYQDSPVVPSLSTSVVV